QSRQRRRRHQPYTYADQSQTHPLPQYHSHDITALRAQGHADADLSSPLRDEMRDYAIKSERSQREGEQTEEADRVASNALAPERAGDLLRHGFYRKQRQVFIQRGNLMPNRRNQAFRISRRAHDDGRSSIIGLRLGKI